MRKAEEKAARVQYDWNRVEWKPEGGLAAFLLSSVGYGANLRPFVNRRGRYAVFNVALPLVGGFC